MRVCTCRSLLNGGKWGESGAVDRVIAEIAASVGFLNIFNLNSAMVIIQKWSYFYGVGFKLL